MMRLFLVLLVALWACPSAAEEGYCDAFGQNCGRGTMWNAHHSLDDKVIVGAAALRHPNTPAAAKCALQCMGRNESNFFFYNKEQQMCVTCPKPCHNLALTHEPGYRYFRLGCGPPPSFPDVAASSSFGYPGNAITYSCVNSSRPLMYPGQHTCKSTGQWVLDSGQHDPQCGCGPPPSFPDMTARRTSGYPGNTTNYYCANSSWYLISPGPHTCSSSGVWVRNSGFVNPACVPPGASNQVISGDSGGFTSPNYPSDYTNNLEIYYWVRLSQDKEQTVTANITYDTEICCDYLILNNNGNYMYRGINHTTITFHVNGDYWYARFYTDESITHQGFQLQYSVTG